MSKLYFRYGAMNCGKTTALLQVAHNYEERGQHVIVIKPKVDKKGKNYIVSRLGAKRKVDILLELFEGSERLLAIADKLEELITICRCGRRATFNVRFNKQGKIVFGNQNEIAIDGIDASYESYCGTCYLEKVRGYSKEDILKQIEQEKK